MTTTCFVAIGNSDNNLPQAEWSDFWYEVHNGLHSFASTQFGEWLTATSGVRQSACWGIQVPDEDLDALRDYLSKVAGCYRQDSIALSIGQTEMITRPKIGETGTCRLCGQEMFRTEDDCWHPYSVAKACPPEPSSVPWDAEGWKEFRAAGLDHLRPGREFFVPTPS